MYEQENYANASIANIYFICIAAACNSKPSDADVKTSVDNAIAANSNLSGTYTDVKDGVVTLTGR
jgi:hypothetical protein